MNYCITTTDLYHHGVKGMKWGVRRYQNADGSYKAGAEGRYGGEGSRKPNSSISAKGQNGSKRITDSGRQKKRLKAIVAGVGVAAAVYGGYKLSKYIKTPMADVAKTAEYAAGKKNADMVLSAGTNLSRIQTSDALQEYPFFATYMEEDSEFYKGLFGKNLYDRAVGAAKRGLKQAAGEEEIAKATEALEAAKNTKVYQLSIDAAKDIKIPSTENAANVMHDLMGDSGFKEDLRLSIEDSASKMKRPGQQLVFKRAMDVLQKDGDLSARDKNTLYRAFNMSLTNHEEYENRTQTAFYDALKKQGYSALTDINDRDLSSYHAKHPVIVFDNDAVSFKAATQLDLNELGSVTMNAQSTRVRREAVGGPASVVKEYYNKTLSEAEDFMKSAMKKYTR